MAYKNNVIRTSDAYQFTINTENDKMLIALKNAIAKHNFYWPHCFDINEKINTEFLRVCVKPRGPRTSSSYHTLTKDATHFDVYVQRRY